MQKGGNMLKNKELCIKWGIVILFGILFVITGRYIDRPKPRVEVIERVTHDSIFIPSIKPVKESLVTQMALSDSIRLYRQEIQRLINLPPDTIIEKETVIKYITADYFSSKSYDTTLVNDSLLYANLRFDINRCKPENLRLEYKVYNKEVRIYEEKRNHLYAGLGIELKGKPFVLLNYGFKDKFYVGGGIGSGGFRHLQVSYKIW